MIWSAIVAMMPDWLGWAMAGLAAIVGAWLAGSRNRAVQGQNDTLRGHIDTTKRMQNADADLPDNVDDTRDLLRTRDPDKR